jgi:threonine/homoserine/homoserine lactone efflux protein
MFPMHVLPFLAVAVVVVITPGVDMALVTKNALVHGRRQALATAFGINLGVTVWTVAAALGVAAAVQASAEAFAVIKFAGALYLIYLGAQALRSARRAHRETALVGSALGTAGAFRQGLVSNLLDRCLLHQPAAAVRRRRAMRCSRRAAASSCSARASRVRSTT